MENKICKNCNKEFIPSKNDVRIKFCSEQCRNEFRSKNKYTSDWLKNNREHVKKYRNKTANERNERRRKKYSSDSEYRESQKLKSKQYRENNPIKRKENDLINKYGISYQEYLDILKNQNYKCAICGIDINESNIQFNIDHSHETGKVRGILCSKCNFGIGQFNDDIGLLKNAIRYLRGK